MATEASASRLPWVWVIEALSRCHQVDATILYDLITGMPRVSGDLEKEVREMVTWRCLESLFDPVNGLKNDCHPSLWSKIQLDSSESAETVLESILQETSASNLRNAGPDLSNRDVLSFIERKKACLPRCSLEQLKDAILQDTHPLAAALKEISGLDEIIIDGKATPARGSINSPKIKCKMLQENSPKTVEITENHAQGSPSNMDNGGLHGKKLKLHAACDVHDLANHIPSRCMKNSKLSLDGNHDNGEFSCRQSNVPCKANRAECGQNACVDEAKGDTEGCLRLRGLGDFPSEKANDTINGKPHGQELEDEANRTMKNRNEAETAYDSDKCHDEDTDVAMKKQEFLCSHHSLTRESSATTDWTEKNYCMKCSESGEVLNCSGSGCPLVIHLSCLGFSATYDNRGNLYCPFCTYSHAISEYVVAKKKASLARKELSLFIGGKTGSQMKDHSKRLSENKLNHHASRHSHEQRKERGKTAIDQQWFARGAKRKSIGTDVDCCPDDVKSSHGDERAIVLVEADCGPGTNQGGSQLRIPDQSKDENPDRIAEDENEYAITSSYTFRCHNQEISYAYPAAPQLRRKKVAWTALEEEMLKEGVRRFADSEGKVIPWKSILEFGSLAFQKGRTPTDLKDKWRNLSRGRTP
ncbi:hypothetical protein Nepgr_030202 [Nepenthes gracilis]|uniref:Myb-like domain-containing protein n=1 Tax=Nepenthes gracilis TaxID=150966 RepID=A0AAD3TFS1_NEPGR|nr:hypothetical protein Nepgr_030202 [Nepenthes gracilis]